MAARVHTRRRPAALALIGLTAATALTVGAALRADAAPLGLGEASSFAVLAGSAVTNTGPSVIDGNVGVSPGLAVSGFPPAVLVGASMIYAGATAQTPQADLGTAYTNAQSAISTPVAAQLGGTAPTPGVYSGVLGTLQITGDLVLDAGGDANASWIFQAASTLVTASSSRVVLTNGASACNVYWQVGSSATLGTSSLMVGTVMALTSITATTGADVMGRLLARNGAVTLDTNDITTPGACVEASTFPATGGVTTSTVAVGGVSVVNSAGAGAGVGAAALPGAQLAATGVETGPPLTAGLLAIAVGAALVMLARRRRPRHRVIAGS